ncbi:ribonuclease R [Candidatus Synechococcus calcipolaris G9]|uniref:Ribonuclease R n=1 Tax=Candidatus Synechococcus calcipolaris G9 TaxID=1497997 RepID=A0ABT6EW37_9SYNE|nr:ribonuclease R family protein [Candidatus Synechococcus calcipolaris]MDG2989995.1 ribonuclease R [Candidatus Synechococcus calcipolaris G9]
MEKGTLVEFRLQNQRRLGVFDRPEGKKHWILIDQNQQSHTVHPRQVTYVVNGNPYRPQDIAAFIADVTPLVEPDSLEIAWEIIAEERRPITATDLALVLFSETLPNYCYAAHCLLAEDKLYFKQKGEVYEARSPAQVTELKHQSEKERLRQEEEAAFQERITQALQGENVDWAPSDRRRLDLLERYAAALELTPQLSGANDLLQQLGRPSGQGSAFQLLVDLQLWSEHENLFLRRSQIQTSFPQKVVDVAQQCLLNPPPDFDAAHRRDLTHLKVYTIDDEGTQEIDDGLSIESLPEGRERLWIHIADPSRWLDPGDILDQEARRRATTVYLPTGMIPMFPSELATGPMSLVEGATCCALSFGVILEANGAVSEYTICPSLIRPTYRLSYEDVDMMLELAVQAEAELLAIAQWGQIRNQWRHGQGAIQINIPEASIKVNGDQVQILPLNDSPARELVAEMMILTGEVAARFGTDHGVPLPFRSQSQPELPPEQELMLLPPGLVRDSAIRRCMPRSEMGTNPTPHASLGLAAYCQVTSPIRRYSDLLAHMQIKAHLRGEAPPFTPQDLGEILLGLVASVQESILVERQTTRYWCLEFLRRHRNEVWRGILLRWLRPDDALGLILLEDLGVELAMRFQRTPILGESLEVRVSRVDPRTDQIWLEEVRETPATAEAISP